MKNAAIAIGLSVVGMTLLMSGKPAAAANLVTNGGFDDFSLSAGKRGAKTNWNYFDEQYLEANKDDLGWQVTTGGTLEVRRNGVAGKSHDGSSHFMELDAHNYKRGVSADSTLGIFQDIVTKVGKTYKLSFAYAARPNVDGDRNTFETLFGDSFSQEFDGGNGKTQEGREWKTFSTEVVADSDLTRVQFNYLGRRDTLGAHLDSVSVEEVPEPTSILSLMLVGMLGAKSVSKRKQA